MYITISQQICGWHVLVHVSDHDARSRLAAEVVAKTCVEFAAVQHYTTALDQLKAVMIGLYAITEGIEPECNNL